MTLSRVKRDASWLVPSKGGAQIGGTSRRGIGRSLANRRTARVWDVASGNRRDWTRGLSYPHARAGPLQAATLSPWRAAIAFRVAFAGYWSVDLNNSQTTPRPFIAALGFGHVSTITA